MATPKTIEEQIERRGSEIAQDIREAIANDPNRNRGPEHKQHHGKESE
jgi:hypothetical protein